MRIAVAIITVAVLSLAWRVTAVTWVSPSAPDPGGNVAAPLNTSGTAQTKRGSLIIQGATIIPSAAPLTIGTAGGQSRICWNGVCRANWSEINQLIGYLHLQTANPTSPDTGYVNIQGANSSVAPAAISGVAGTPTSTTPTFGVLGEASALAGTSYGLFAAAEGGSPQYAVFADNAGMVDAWAGYFSGHVAISNAGGEGFDLFVGLGTPPASGPGSNDPIRSEICLGGDCRFEWPNLSGTGFWSLVVNELRPVTVGRSAAASGNGALAPFRVEVATDVGGNPTNASLNVLGGAQFDQYVVGSPTAAIASSLTCGDGICTNPPENDTSCSPRPCGNPVGSYYCPEDCDVTATQNVNALRDNVVDTPCNPCVSLGPPFLRIRWNNPAEVDYAGVRIIIRTDRFPSAPIETVLKGDFAASTVQYEQGCNVGTTYYAGLYAYDQVGNYASGLLLNPACHPNTKQAPPPPPPPPPPEL